VRYSKQGADTSIHPVSTMPAIQRITRTLPHSSYKVTHKSPKSIQHSHILEVNNPRPLSYQSVRHRVLHSFSQMYFSAFILATFPFLTLAIPSPPSSSHAPLASGIAIPITMYSNSSKVAANSHASHKRNDRTIAYALHNITTSPVTHHHLC
jgi:hypothetical protein